MSKIVLSAFADEASKNLDGQIEALKRNGLEYIDVRVTDGKNVFDLSVDEAKDIYARLKKGGISVNCLGSPVGKVNLDVEFDAYRKRFNALLDTAEIMNTDKIRVFAFYEHNGNLPLITQYMTALCEDAKARGVKLYLENEARVYGENADEVNTLLSAVPLLNDLYDPANYVLGGQDLDVAMDLLLKKRKTEFLHIKDATYSGAIVACGEGEGRVREAVSHCTGSDLYMTIEPHLFQSKSYKEFDGKELINKRVFNNEGEAFDYAVTAVRKTLEGIL